MADPLDQRIIAAIVTRMQTITTANGYQTNIDATKVADSRTNWDEEDDLNPAAISVYQGITRSAEAPTGRRKTIHIMPVMVKGFLKRGTTAANARTLSADIKKAIRGTGTQGDNFLAERWPVNGIGLAMETREVGGGPEYAEGTFEITGVQVELEIVFLTSKFNAEG